MRKTLTRLALAGVAVTALAGAAVAQVPPPPPAPPAPPMAPPPPMPPLPPMEAMMAMGPDMMGSNMMFMHHGGHADPEKRAQRLRDILQLRPDQDGALKAYLDATTMKIEIKKDVVIKDKGDMKDKKDGEKAEWVERAPPTTLERLDHMSKAADMMKKRADATRAFYLALTPAQQKTFDVLGMSEGGARGGPVMIHRFDTRGPAVFKSGGEGGERRVIIQRKVG